MMKSSADPVEDDGRWMRAALQLARDSVGLASPNPQVGCVLVRHGAIVGQGAHHYDQKDHAEIVALREAGNAARGATAYVTLEPCAHTGRTGPCATALLQSGVARVVIATGDPNPQVNGQGAAMLREGGVSISMGTLADEARVLNDGFARWIRTGLPLVDVKAALSLDGRIAPPQTMRRAGSVTYLTGARSLMAVHRMRHIADAVLTGIGTVLTDDPLLTDRSGGARRRKLLRVVLDSRLQLPLASRIVQSAEEDVLVMTADDSPSPQHADRKRTLTAAGVRVCEVPRGVDGRLDLPSVLRVLGSEHSVLHLLAEGGSHLNRALLDRATGPMLADRLTLFYAPMLLGDRGVPLLAGDSPLQLEFRRSVIRESGSDFRIDACLRDPWHRMAEATVNP